MRGWLTWVLAGALAAALPAPASASAGRCSVHVPGAERSVAACLDDLTTTGTVASGHTVEADWAGLTSAGLPAFRGVPGVQVDGYFPDTSTANTNHGWNHDAQFVLRLPDRWNGGLVVTGSPGVRRQYANDRAIGDQALAEGYAFAATDKGNTGAAFFTDGVRPGDALAEWNSRVTQLTLAARAAAARHYGRPVAKTLAAGLSNGGYLVRWQLENRPWLYDGGVDWEGTLWRADGPSLLTFLPPALRAYPAYAAGSPSAHQSILDAGFAPGSEFLWDYHYRVYWDLTQRIYREEVDPSFDGPLEAGTPFCASGTPSCDADYAYASRPPSVARAVERISLTGRIGKPLLTLHGTLDTLLPITRDSDVYDRMITAAGRGALHRYYRIEGGNHVDGLVDAFPDRLRPLGPCFRTAFDALGGWLRGTRPPASATIARPAGATPAELATSCDLVSRP
ncbi:tannase/feruloyl esterase family alpha/beta hydrolase [Amycolatopsis sp. DG1A-15b]|uniref:3-hydroxybutyrate oligomer hydrolase family protein n=1 Tax=Amycolatopsis sp. DG1A-15b TaxID=3052846 RepID=UPI00255BA9FF|nr:tannase/feruloyl esterase family alpha/beta hydrolase [Amycolatopsis sp. DG1A-15b]WIX92734.1 tannase/feruloyl esterase family alpha/beta hydrolase [Amycolatopsis sp. DG1A-15b]